MNGFKELVTKRIMHRDFKPANIFLHEENVIIGDFGMAKSGTDYAKTHLGTPQTMAPEVLFTEQDYVYSNKTDLWSIGISFYMMLFGMDGPYNAFDLNELKKSIVDHSGENLYFPASIPISNDAKD